MAQAVKFLLGLIIWPVLFWPFVGKRRDSRLYLYLVCFGIGSAISLLYDFVFDPEALTLSHFLFGHVLVHFGFAIFARDIIQRREGIRLF